MQHLLTLFEQLGQFWLYGVAFAGVLGSAYGAWRLFRARVLFVIRAADAVRRVYGDDAEAVVEYWYARQKTIAIQDVRQRLLESHLGFSVFVCDSDGRCEFVNEELAEMFGIDAAACSGFGWLEAVDPNDRKIVHETWMFCVTNKIPYEKGYRLVNRRSGEHLRVVARAYPVVRHSGEILCYVGTVTLEETDKAESTSR